MDKYKSLKAAVIITDIFIVLLIAMAIALPWLVTWYVEVVGRSASLPTTIMVTCYPCAPFAGATLMYLRRLLKYALKSDIFSCRSIKCLRRISICCFIIAVITLFAGRYYLPFYIVGATFAFLALLVFALKAIFMNVENTEQKD